MNEYQFPRTDPFTDPFTFTFMGHCTNASRRPRKMNQGALRRFKQARTKLEILDSNIR
jgi:hypothetical protein